LKKQVLPGIRAFFFRRSDGLHFGQFSDAVTV